MNKEYLCSSSFWVLQRNWTEKRMYYEVSLRFHHEYYSYSKGRALQSKRNTRVFQMRNTLHNVKMNIFTLFVRYLLYVCDFNIGIYLKDVTRMFTWQQSKGSIYFVRSFGSLIGIYWYKKVRKLNQKAVIIWITYANYNYLFKIKTHWIVLRIKLFAVILVYLYYNNIRVSSICWLGMRMRYSFRMCSPHYIYVDNWHPTNIPSRQFFLQLKREFHYNL